MSDEGYEEYYEQQAWEDEQAALDSLSAEAEAEALANENEQQRQELLRLAAIKYVPMYVQDIYYSPNDNEWIMSTFNPFGMDPIYLGTYEQAVEYLEP